MKNRVLVISDLHAPFIHKKALNHCKKVYKKYKCNRVVFIGDVIDNAATTHFLVNPDGKSPTDELTLAINALKPWYKEFPDATVTIGNHERRIIKCSQSSAISNKWLKTFSEVLEVPRWVFIDEVVIDNVKYTHGEGCGSTYQSVLHSDTSIVFGHYHGKFEIMYLPTKFAMCVGWLGDDTTYAFEYGRHHTRKSVLGCGVVIDGLPFLEPLK